MAAILLDREYIGIENSAEYVKEAQENIEELKQSIGEGNVNGEEISK